MPQKGSVEVVGMHSAKRWARSLDFTRKEWQEKLPRGEKLPLPAKRDYLHPPSDEIAQQWLAEVTFALEQIKIWLEKFAHNELVDNYSDFNKKLKKELKAEQTFWKNASEALNSFLERNRLETELVRKAFQMQEGLRLALEMITQHKDEMKFLEGDEALLLALSTLARENKLIPDEELYR